MSVNSKDQRCFSFGPNLSSDRAAVAPSRVDAVLQGVVGIGSQRATDDFYATDPNATRRLLGLETFGPSVWEPACGNGSMSKVLEEYSTSVRSTDLVDRGYGTAGIDFTDRKTVERFDPVDAVITNPPFKHSDAFLRHALLATEKKRGKVAMLNKLNWLTGVKRYRLFQDTPIAKVWVFSKEPDFYKNGTELVTSSLIEFAWFVWDWQFIGEPRIGWIER